MRRIDAGTSGQIAPPAAPWTDLHLSTSWLACVGLLASGRHPRPLQMAALGQHNILGSRRNLIVSAPTNAGKTLIGHLMLLEALCQRRRAVLIVPLRAIARERADELTTLAPALEHILGCRVTIRVSTGDYRLQGELFISPPPNEGEIVIATPERFDAILRNPDHNAWIDSIGAVCIDEAHLIGSKNRGPTLEYLITSLLCLHSPPRLVLLSASLGDTRRAAEWLSPCDVISVSDRYPSLAKEVVELGADEDVNDVVAELARDALDEPEASVLVFVYQTRSAERLASLLQRDLGASAGADGPLAYHAQMSAAQRQTVREAFQSGRCRCLVATTALALGVNLPATHVIVRDTLFPGVGKVPADDLLQMLGRAGRGDRSGSALALVRPNDAWMAEELACALRNPILPTLVSHYEQCQTWEGRRQNRSISDATAVARHVAAYLARYPDSSTSANTVRAFFDRSLGGPVLAGHVDGALSWLCDPGQVLAYQDEQGGYRLTVLGLRATRSMLPLHLVAGFAQLVRDLLSLDPSDHLLARWSPLDHLLILTLLYEGSPNLRRFSSALVDQIDMWMEQHQDRPSLLYREWVVGQQGASRAAEVLGSLGIHPPTPGPSGEQWSRKVAYQSLLCSIVLTELGSGVTPADLERQWGIQSLEGIEERWRDDFLWLLAGVSSICDLRCFYFHLREGCDADGERIHRVKNLLHRLRSQSLDLQEVLKYCSPLGPILRSLRQTQSQNAGPSVGPQTIRRLEGIGIRNLTDLIPMGIDELVRVGVRRDLAKQIRAYVRRRLLA